MFKTIRFAKWTTVSFMTIAACFCNRVAANPEPIASPSVPAIRATVSSQPPKSPLEMNWAGVGLRYGTASWSLRAEGLRGAIAKAIPSYGQGAANLVSDLNDSLRVITPTLHTGGDHFFFKLELPIGTSDTLKTYGLGVYPLNYGRFIPSLRLFPYITAGAAAHLVTGRQDARTDNSKAAGVVAQTRVSIGMKWRPISMISLSFDVGYSPWAAGFVGSRGETTSNIGPVSTNASGKGGTGHMTDFSLGIEIL
jgi:hypothetical protein